MTQSPNKSNQYIWFAIKGIVLAVAVGFLYLKSKNASFSVSYLAANISWSESWLWLLFFILLATMNWLLESEKWRLLAATEEKISYAKAIKQSLAAHSTAMITPNKIGEYGTKAIFFVPEKRKRILALTLFGNLAQLTATLLFGIIGLLATYRFLMGVISPKKILGVILVVSILVATAFFFRKKTLFIRGFSLQKLVRFIKQLKFTLKLKVLLLSLIRYIVFSTLFYVILIFLGAEISFNTAMPIIFSMYFFSSIIPIFSLFDVLIKGSVAVWLFQFFDISETLVLTSAFCMWVLNTVFPALIGMPLFLKLSPK